MYGKLRIIMEEKNGSQAGKEWNPKCVAQG
jgi:hypothetical protein